MYKFETLVFLTVIASTGPPVKTPHVTCVTSLRENAVADTLGACHFYAPEWRLFSWIGPRRYPRASVSTCYPKPRMRCINNGAGYVARIKGSSIFHLYQTRPISRKHQGTWECVLALEKGFQRISCQLKVYEPPHGMNCSTTTHPLFLFMTCTTPKVYPKAACVWTHKYKSDPDFRPLTGLPLSKHTAYLAPSNKNEYFRSTCYVHLRSDSNLHFGLLTVRLEMRPGLAKVASSASVFDQRQFEIEPPADPVFLFFGQAIDDSHLTQNDRDVIQLECRVPGGHPQVRNVNLQCQFSIDPGAAAVRATEGRGKKGVGTANGTDNGQQYHVVERGISYVTRIQVRREFDRKLCWCWGSHLTGELRKSSLTFGILHPAKIVSFDVVKTGKGRRKKFHLACIGEGRPVVLVSVWKAFAGDVDDVKKLNESAQHVTWTVSATCRNIGLYVCKAGNRFRGEDTTVSRQLVVRKTCPVTRCDGAVIPVIFPAWPGQNISRRLCIQAHPPPPADAFQLFKGVDGKWNVVSKPSVTMEIVEQGGVMLALTIVFRNVSQPDFGDYALYRRQGGNASSEKGLVTKFALIEIKGEPTFKDGIGSEVLVVIVVLINFLLALFFVALAAFVKQIWGMASHDVTPEDGEEWQISPEETTPEQPKPEEANANQILAQSIQG